jgi:hypothetical protein
VTSGPGVRTRVSTLTVSGVLMALLVLTACHRDDEPAASDVPGVDSPTTRIRVRDVTLGPGDSVGIAFHPTKDRAKVLVVSDQVASLRLCAGTGGGEPASNDSASSWAEHWRGHVCRRIDGRRSLTLPSFSAHVAFVIHNGGDKSTDVNGITLSYRAHDRYNVVRLPDLAPGAVSGRVFVPTDGERTAIVGAQASWQLMAPGVLQLSIGSSSELLAEAPRNTNAYAVSASIDTRTLLAREVRDVVARVRNTGPRAIRPTVSF